MREPFFVFRQRSAFTDLDFSVDFLLPFFVFRQRSAFTDLDFSVDFLLNRVAHSAPPFAVAGFATPRSKITRSQLLRKPETVPEGPYST